MFLKYWHGHFSITPNILFFSFCSLWAMANDIVVSACTDCVIEHIIAWKMSKYGVISGPYFSVFGLNTERYGVFSPNTEKCGPEITPYLDTFHAVHVLALRGDLPGKRWRQLLAFGIMLLIICLKPTMIIHFSITSLEVVLPKISINLLFLPHKLKNRKLWIGAFKQTWIRCYIALGFLLIRSPKEGTWKYNFFLHANILDDMA